MSVDQPILDQPGRASPLRTLVLFVCLPIFAFTLFGLMLMLDYSSDRYAMIGLALVTAVIALVPVILDQARPVERRHLLLTFYCLLFIAHFCMPIFTHYAIGPMPTDPPGVAWAALYPADIVTGQAVALAGLISFLLGYALLPLRVSNQEVERRRSRDWPPVVIPVVAGLMLAIGWTVVIATTAGLVPAALGSGLIGTIGSSVTYGNVLLTVAAVRHHSRIAWIMLAFAVPISSGLGFLTGSKTSTLIVPAIVLFTGMLLGGRLRARWMVVGAISLTLLYPVAQFYRQDVLRSNTLTIVDALSDSAYTFELVSDFVSSSRPGQYMVEGMEAMFGRLDTIGIESVIVRDTPSVSPFQNGRTLGLFFVAFVPRLLWPEKPEITLGKWITATYGSGGHIQSYTGPSFIGDLYLNFGLISVVIGMLIMGALLRLIHYRFLGPYPTTIGILTAIIVMVQVLIRQEGTVGHTLSTTVFAFAPVFVVSIMVALLLPGKAAPRAPSWSEQDDDGSDVGVDRDRL
jgi:hypothetical protein